MIIPNEGCNDTQSTDYCHKKDYNRFASRSFSLPMQSATCGCCDLLSSRAHTIAEEIGFVTHKLPVCLLTPTYISQFDLK